MLAKEETKQISFSQKLDDYIWEKFAYQGEKKPQIPMSSARIRFLIFVGKSIACMGLTIFALFKFVPFLPRIAKFIPL